MGLGYQKLTPSLILVRMMVINLWGKKLYHVSVKNNKSWSERHKNIIRKCFDSSEYFFESFAYISQL